MVFVSTIMFRSPLFMSRTGSVSSQPPDSLPLQARGAEVVLAHRVAVGVDQLGLLMWLVGGAMGGAAEQWGAPARKN